MASTVEQQQENAQQKHHRSLVQIMLAENEQHGSVNGVPANIGIGNVEPSSGIIQVGTLEQVHLYSTCIFWCVRPILSAGLPLERPWTLPASSHCKTTKGWPLWGGHLSSKHPGEFTAVVAAAHTDTGSPKSLTLPAV